MILRSVGLFWLALAGVLAGCAAAPEPHIVHLTVTAEKDLNPGENGDPLPVIVRLYRMSSSVAFDRASYGEVYADDEKAIGRDLVGVTEFLFFPGQRETISRQFKPEERFLGVLVAYRDPGQAKWRASTAVPTGDSSHFELHLDRHAASLRLLR